MATATVATRKARPLGRWPRLAERIVQHTLLIVLSVVFLIPLFWMVSGSVKTIGLLAAGLALCVIWVWREVASDEPLVDMTMMRIRGVWTANLAAFLLGFLGVFVVQGASHTQVAGVERSLESTVSVRSNVVEGIVRRNRQRQKNKRVLNISLRSVMVKISLN